MSDESEQHILLKSWHSALKRATDFDAWGQPVEASDIYHGLSKQLFDYADDKECCLFTKYQKRTFEKIALCLESRRKRLSENESHQNISVDLRNLKLLEETLAKWLKDGFEGNDRLTFPIEFSASDGPSKIKYQQIIDDDDKSTAESSSTTGKSALLPKPLPISGKSFLTVFVDHIGLKDGSQFIDPCISLSVRDQHGHPLESTQDTPGGSSKSDNTIDFHCDVHIQQAMESLPPGFAIFFEFKHFKPKKDSFSTRFWSFVEHDEIKDGPLALELYKKPADFKRKSLKLLTVKPLFLHLQLSLDH